MDMACKNINGDSFITAGQWSLSSPGEEECTHSEGKGRCDDGSREQFEAGFECGGRNLRQGMWFQNMEEAKNGFPQVQLWEWPCQHLDGIPGILILDFLFL